jgi:LemA protein
MVVGTVITVTVVVLAAIALIWGVSTYNTFIELDNQVEQTWGNIDVLLKQRQDEIPNLIDTVKQYADHEQDIFTDVAEKRKQMQNASSKQEKAEANQAMQGALSNLFAIAEDYPDLKANENFQQLQDRITGIENEIADRRERYNEAVTIYNTKQDQLPAAIIANWMNLDEEDLFDVDRAEYTAENAYSGIDDM